VEREADSGALVHFFSAVVAQRLFASSWTPQCAPDVVRVVVERSETVRDGHRASVDGVDVDVDVGVGVLGAARGVSSRVVAARERRARCARGRHASEWR